MSASRARVACALLAAGRGRRMGGDKHLLALDGEPLVSHALRALLAARTMPPVVVLRADDDRGRALAAGWAERGVTVAVVEDVDEGRAASVRTAVGAASERCEALLIALADQPWLVAADFDRLVDSWEAAGPDAIVHARYAGQRGTPVLFGRRYFAELLELRGSEGGRAVIARHPEARLAVDLEPAHGRDLDRPEDWPENGSGDGPGDSSGGR